MSTQQDIYVAGSESRPPMLNKENYVPWSSRLLRYAKSRPNGKLIHNSILNGPYVRRMIPEPGDANRKDTTILLGLPEDIYAAVDSYETAQDIWLRPEWSRHVTIVHQTKDLHTTDYTQLYDFLKYNQKEVDELKAERLAKTQDPLALIANSNNPYAFPAPHQDQSSFNQNYLQQLMPNPEDIIDPTTEINMALALMAKAFKLNYSSPTNNNQRISSNPHNRQIAQPGMNMGQDRQMQMVGGNGGNQFRQHVGQNVGNLTGYNDVQNIGNQVIQNALQNLRVQNVRNQNGLIGVPGNGNQNGNGNLVAAHAEGNAVGQNGNQIRKRQESNFKQKSMIYWLLQQILMKLRKSMQTAASINSAPVYDSDGSAEVHENCDDNEIFNMFTQEEQYTELPKPIPKSHQVPHNDNDVIFEDTGMEQGREIVEQHPVNFEETRALYDSLYQNLATEVEKVNSVNRKLKETNADLTTELARFKIKQGVLKLVKKNMKNLKGVTNSLFIRNNLSKEKSTVSFLLEEKKRLKSDFKTYEDELLDKQIQLEKKIKELNNIFVKTGQSIQTIHMLSPKPDSFYHSEQKMALGYQNPFYLKQAQKKQQRLYDGKVLLEKHDPPVVHDSEETLQLAQESREKMKQLNKEIKPANYTKINHLSGAKFIGDFKSLANEADASLAKHKALELKIERLLKAVVSQDIMNIVQKESVVDTSDLQTELERVNNDKVITPGMFRINPSKTSREEKHVPNRVSASTRTKPITVSQPSVITKKDVNSNLNGLSSTGVDNTKTRRPQPKSNTKHDRVSSASKSSQSKNKEAEDVISKVVCATCKQCLISINHDVCLRNYVNGQNSRAKKQKANVSVKEIQRKYQPKVTKPKKVGFPARLATPKPKKPRFLLRWSPTGILFDQKGKLVASSKSESQSDCSNNDNACTSNTLEPKIKRFPNSTSLLDRNDLVSGLPKFKYHKEHLCPSCEQGKSKRASHPPKPVPNSRQRLHLLHMDLCGPMRIASINGKRNAHVKRTTKWKLKRLDQGVAEYPNGYDPLA
nr:ribonuclease H-like domain-containing protein [Tanacetum cinerariifolium]